jgi:hypothetical protein
MDDILALLKDLSPFVVLAYLVILDNRAKVKAAEVEAATEKYRAESDHRRDEREAKLATSLAEEQTRRAEADRLRAAADLQTAAIQAQNVVAWGLAATAQKQTTQAVVKSEKRVIASEQTSSEGLSDALKKVLEGIVELTAGQVGQTTAIESLQAAFMELAGKLKATPGGEEAGEVIEEAALAIPVPTSAAEAA